MKIIISKVLTTLIIIVVLCTFRNPLIENILNHTIPAFFYSLGASIMIILLMYFHYMKRKDTYSKLKNLIENTTIPQTKELQSKLIEKLNEIYKSYNADNLHEFLNNIQKKEISESNIKIILAIVQDYEKSISGYDSYILKQKLQILHFDNYSFWSYVYNVLNRKYPDEAISKLLDVENNK